MFLLYRNQFTDLNELSTSLIVFMWGRLYKFYLGIF